MISLYRFPEIYGGYEEHKDYKKEFRKKFSSFIGKKNCYLIDNGRTSIYYILKEILKLEKKDEVIVPAYTCWSVSEAVNKVCRIVFADIDKYTFNINTTDVERKITQNTKAVIAIHLFGNPCEMKKLQKICKENGIKLIEDCAQAVGSLFNNNKVGSFGDFSIFSFSKDLNCGGGGAILTDEKLEIDLPHENNEIDKGGEKIHSFLCSRPRLYYFLKMNLILPYLNYNSKKINLNPSSLSNFKCFLLLRELKNLNARVSKRRKNVEYISGNIKLDVQKETGKSSFYRFSIKVKNRDKIVKKMMLNGIETGLMYNYYCSPKGHCPNSEDTAKKIINIPVRSDLKKEELDYIIKCLNRFLK